MSSPYAPGRAKPAPWPVLVMQALDALDGVSRSALRLIYFGGLTQAEAARRLAIPEPAMRTSVARGMRELAEQLAHAAT